MTSMLCLTEHSSNLPPLKRRKQGASYITLYTHTYRHRHTETKTHTFTQHAHFEVISTAETILLIFPSFCFPFFVFFFYRIYFSYLRE